jgi:hypothetical protein
MTDEELNRIKKLQSIRDEAIKASNCANQAGDHLDNGKAFEARESLRALIHSFLNTEQLEVICDLAIAFTAKNLKQAQKAYEKA